MKMKMLTDRQFDELVQMIPRDDSIDSIVGDCYTDPDMYALMYDYDHRDASKEDLMCKMCLSIVIRTMAVSA